MTLWGRGRLAPSHFYLPGARPFISERHRRKEPIWLFHELTQLASTTLTVPFFSATIRLHVVTLSRADSQFMRNKNHRDSTKRQLFHVGLRLAHVLSHCCRCRGGLWFHFFLELENVQCLVCCEMKWHEKRNRTAQKMRKRRLGKVKVVTKYFHEYNFHTQKRIYKVRSSVVAESWKRKGGKKRHLETV